MSVTLNVCRFVTCYQSDVYHQDAGAFAFPRKYDFIEIVSTGWEQGARCRQKRFPSFERLFAYLNKLHVHEYLDDSNYESAWAMVLEVESWCTEPPHRFGSLE